MNEFEDLIHSVNHFIILKSDHIEPQVLELPRSSSICCNFRRR